jgi:hypothetical protein
MRGTTAILALALMATVTVAAQEPPGRISRIEFQPATVEEGGGVFISLIGSGHCSYLLDFGDGTSERRKAQLPDRVRHAYPGDGEFLVVATPDTPCEGVARAKLDVRAINQGLWGMSAEAGPDAPNAELLVTLRGRGECAITLDFGDGTVDKLTVTLPATRSHKYGKVGVYELKAVAEPPCRGEAAITAEIKR